MSNFEETQKIRAGILADQLDWPDFDRGPHADDLYDAIRAAGYALVRAPAPPATGPGLPEGVT